ncbi:hypothetical protein TVAG_235120 [Trichomonas vaginalis G3]|uniref:Intraflagellar transport protein 52 n=1 Tax=Trichomonas vaginalis (strain ATCC PRA-98 / G3) TaxID=412133 RepID=A2DPN1_TRIV3|nr:intraciliary anterograde transport [Trichomonas vaginalis G3]EAY17631.1 hypothetical protein TVAG_235120 [Trichomonas vaginalis G3]KAI5486124.1 intraciliary anterograde transport [Trichomonas vaginalis G3]|eukprot:XP_001329766.1 hypothetical protein [Trichomonas vaginalis G3]
MSTYVSIIDAGHREYLRREKRLGIFCNSLSQISEVRSSKDPITNDLLKGVNSIWFMGPRNDLNKDEASVLQSFLKNGGNVIIAGAENFPSGFNAFISQYGVKVTEPVISPVYINYIDPHQVSIQHGILNHAITEFIKDDKASFAFPNGCILEVNRPSVPIISSGLSAYPLNCPVISFTSVEKGTLTVIGSPLMFGDEWFRKEQNEQLFNFLIQLILVRSTQLNKIDADNPEVTERWFTPDTISMSERLRPCIQESEKLKPNLIDNFDKAKFSMDMRFVADIANLANTLGVKNEQLDIVTPVFDVALPPRTPAVFPPQMKEPEPPVLELFDLNEIFASKTARLAMLAQKTPPKNIEKFIMQAAKILNVGQKFPQNYSAKDVLEYVFKYVVRCKRQAQD